MCNELPKFEGAYYFDSSFLKLSQTQHIVNLINNTEEARQSLNFYKNKGYSCRYVMSNSYQCKKFNKENVEDQEVRQRVLNQFSAMVLNFRYSTDEYFLINEGEVIKEFEKNQESSFDEQKFNKVHLYITADLIKLKLYDANKNIDADYFYLNSFGFISKQITIAKKNKPSASFIIEDKHFYLYEGVWKQ